jgi:hypothetical protein
MARKKPQVLTAPVETPVIGEWKRATIRLREEDKSVWAMVFKSGGTHFGIFQATFNSPVTDPSYIAQKNGIVSGNWTVMHVDTGSLLYMNSQKTPGEALLFFKHFRKVNFGATKEDKKRFAEAVEALAELHKEKRG